MLKLLTLEPEAFGLDFSDLSLKIVKLKKKGKFLSLASWGEVKIKPGIIEEGEIKNETALVEVIKEGLNKIEGEKLKTRNVVASLPEKKAFLQVIQMPKMKKEELKTAVLFEAENYIPLPVEKVYLDFQLVVPVHPVRDHARALRARRAFGRAVSNGVHDHLDHLDILIAALPKKTVDPYLSCLKKAGLLPQVLEVESQSISRALIKNGVSPFPLFIIDFGKSRTSFIIFSGYSLRFTSSIPISSQKLTETISQTLGVNLAGAEKLKLKYGLRPPKETIKNKKISEAMTPVLTDLIKQIKKYINYYHTHSSHEYLSPDGEGIKKILLCGRGANLKGLTDFISSELEIPVELGNPWINILPEPLKEVPELPFKESLGYTSALGLALRGISDK